MTEVMVYGANGFTGRLVVERLLALGIRPVLAGRSGSVVVAMAEERSLPSRVFTLDGPDAAMRGLEGIAAVVNAAGPFVETAEAMVEGCIATGTHYCDVTGEIDVFERLIARDADAAEAGIVFLPGVGFDVTPSDCLLAYVAARVGSPSGLRLSIGGTAQVSRGTVRTMIAMSHRGTAVRRDGRIVWKDELPRSRIDFGEGPVGTIGVSYGDVATAAVSTDARDVSVFAEASPALAAAVRGLSAARDVVGTTVVRSVLNGLVDLALPTGPSAERRGGGGMTLVAEAWGEDGRRAAAVLRTPEVYSLTALAAAESVRRLGEGTVPAGYRTPSDAFGPDYVLAFQGVDRTDVEPTRGEDAQAEPPRPAS